MSRRACDDGKRSSAGSCWHRSFGGGGRGGELLGLCVAESFFTIKYI